MRVRERKEWKTEINSGRKKIEIRKEREKERKREREREKQVIKR